MRLLLLASFLVLLATLPAAAQDPSVPHRNKAYQFARDGKYADAIAEISKAIELKPENASLRIDRAGFHRAVNDLTSLEADIADAISLAPNDEIIVIRASQVLLTARNCERALAVVSQFISQHSRSDRPYATRALVYGCLKNFPAAMADITMAIELRPENPTYRATQAQLLAQLGNSDEALELLRGIIDSLEQRIADESNAQRKQMRKRELALMYTTRAGLFNRASRYDESIADLTRAIELDPRAPIFHSRAMTYRSARRYDAAIADFDRLIVEDNGRNAYAFYGRGDIHMMLGNYEKAVADFEQALKLGTPSRSMIETKLAAAKQKLGRNPQQ